MDQRTLAKYFDYLKRWFFISLCFNFVKKPLKSSRIIKKAYLTSVNFAIHGETSLLVENYVFNFLQKTYRRVHFYKDKEIDFIAIDKDRNIFLYESKYQNEIKKEDEKNLLDFMTNNKVNGAYIITKRHYNMHRAIKQIPASFLEFVLKT